MSTCYNMYLTDLIFTILFTDIFYYYYMFDQSSLMDTQQVSYYIV